MASLDAKNDLRESRLSNRKMYLLQKKFLAENLDQCKEDITAFGACAEEHGFMVIFKCRDLNSKMSNCLEALGTDERFDEYVRKHTSSNISKE